MSETVGDDFPRQQERLRQCLQNGIDIGASGFFYVALCRDLLQRADKAAISGDVVEILRVYQAMRDFTE